MTICIAAICENYSKLVLASDSMLTNPGLSIEFEQPTKKMTKLSDQCLALTAGNALAHTELFNSVERKIETLKSPTAFKIVEEIKRCYQSIRKREICERILNPRGFDDFGDFYNAQKFLNPEIAMKIQFDIEGYDYGLQIIAAGLTEGKAQIFGISDPGTSDCFDAIGFHTIGSGTPHAMNTLIARGCHQELPLEEAFMIVYEAKKLAERAPGVGRTTNIAILSEKGTTHLESERIEKISPVYEKWLRRDESWKNDFKSAILE